MSQQADANPVPILARLLQYSREVLEAESSSAVRQRIVANLNQLMVVDRVLMVQPKAKTVSVTNTGADFGHNTPLFDAFKASLPQLPDTASIVNADVAIREANNGSQVYWLPITDIEGLWLEKWGGRQWQEAELKLLEHALPYMRAGLEKPFKRPSSWLRRTRWLVPAGLVLALFIPVNSSVTALASVVSTSSVNVYAPLDGIVHEVRVTPGSFVKPNQLLLSYDDRVMRYAISEAQKEVGVAQAELVRLQGAAYQDSDARSRLPVQRLALKKAQARYQHLKSQIAKSHVQVPVSGTVVMAGQASLVGASVQVGQKLLTIADPKDTEIELFVPVADVSAFAKGATVKVRMDADPLHSYAAEIIYVAHDVVVAKNDVPSIKVRARWVKNNGKPSAIPGQQGVARIEGEKTVLGIKLFRKPLQSLFDWFGI